MVEEHESREGESSACEVSPWSTGDVPIGDSDADSWVFGVVQPDSDQIGRADDPDPTEVESTVGSGRLGVSVPKLIVAGIAVAVVAGSWSAWGGIGSQMGEEGGSSVPTAQPVDVSSDVSQLSEDSGAQNVERDLPPTAVGGRAEPDDLSGALTVLAVVAGDGSASIALVDVESGESEGFDVPAPRATQSRPVLLSNRFGLFVINESTESSYAITAFGQTANVGITFASDEEVVGSVDHEGFWLLERSSTEVVLQPSSLTFEEVVATADAISIPSAQVLGDDGNGGVVVNAVGGVYVIGDAVERLTTGELLAISSDAALVRECNEQLQCADLVLDRRSGSRTEIGIGWQMQPVEARLGIGTLPTIAPNGSAALVRSTLVDSEGGWLYVSFAEQVAEPVAEPDPGTPVLWGDDGRMGTWVSDCLLHVGRRDEGGGVVIKRLDSVGCVTALTTATAV